MQATLVLSQLGLELTRRDIDKLIICVVNSCRTIYQLHCLFVNSCRTIYQLHCLFISASISPTFRSSINQSINCLIYYALKLTVRTEATMSRKSGCYSGNQSLRQSHFIISANASRCPIVSSSYYYYPPIRVYISLSTRPSIRLQSVSLSVCQPASLSACQPVLL